MALWRGDGNALQAAVEKVLGEQAGGAGIGRDQKAVVEFVEFDQIHRDARHSKRIDYAIYDILLSSDIHGIRTHAGKPEQQRTEHGDYKLTSLRVPHKSHSYPACPQACPPNLA